MHLIDRWSIVFTLASLIFSFGLFRSYSGESYFSILAALMTAGLVFASYLIMRVFFLAFYK
jgi:CHASE2 domain-containing sensor protein